MGEISHIAVEIRTKSGDILDAQNIPGAKRKELIESGELDRNSIYAPANLPGWKLKELREQREAAANGHAPINLKPGDMVVYQDTVTKVLGVDRNKGVKITGFKDGKKKKFWVDAKDVVKEEDPEEKEEGNTTDDEENLDDSSGDD